VSGEFVGIGAVSVSTTQERFVINKTIIGARGRYDDVSLINFLETSFNDNKAIDFNNKESGY
jgi:hypothetical protein